MSLVERSDIIYYILYKSSYVSQSCLLLEQPIVLTREVANVGTEGGILF